MRTVISHFYNEEYLLPFWLKHHKKYFDHGIMINYASTDASVQIIKDICPDWEIVDSENKYFDPLLIDEEVMKIEKRVSGWKIALNTTEFLIGNFGIIPETNEPKQIIIPCHLMVDTTDTEFTDIKISLINERQFGIPYYKNNIRSCRSFHNCDIKYGPGRHFQNPNTDELHILYYGFCPMNKITLNRKLQIKNKLVPNPGNSWDSDHRRSAGELLEVHNSYQRECEDMSELIKKYVKFEKIDYLTICYKNYDLILLQIENFKKLFNNNFNLIIVDNTPTQFKNVDLLKKIVEETPNIKIISRDYNSVEFDGISHGLAIDIGLRFCDNDIVCVFDSDFFFLNKNINEYILKLFNDGFLAVGCEFNDGTIDSVKYIDMYPENFNNAPVCYAAFYHKDVAKSNTFMIDMNEVNINRNTNGYIETGSKIRKYIVDNKLKGKTWKAEREVRPCFFKDDDGTLIGVHYVAGSHINFNEKTLDDLKTIINNN